MSTVSIDDRVAQLLAMLQAREAERETENQAVILAGTGPSVDDDDTDGSNGDDLLEFITAPNDLEIDAGKGNDTAAGGFGDDEIEGGKGNDSLTGGEGDDEIEGGKGDDFVAGDGGNDEIDGDDGNDTLFGGLGNDKIDGDKGDDAIHAGGGDDKVKAGDGDDVVLGGDGKDTVDAGKGDDFVDGGADDDKIDGGKGNDTLLGGAGNDEIDGGKDDDTIDGGEGNDTIDGGSGQDVANFDGSILDFTVESTGTGTGNNDDDDDDDDDADITVTDQNAADGDEGSDTLSNVEVLQFDDYTLYLDGTNNGPMVVAADQSTNEDTATAFSAAVYDFDGDTISIDDVSFTGPGAFQVTTATLSPLLGSGVQLNFIFDPDGNYETLGVGETQIETVTIEVSDGNGGTETVTFNVTITGVNDPPVAGDDTASTNEDTTVNITVLTNDSDVEDDTLTVTAAIAASGALVVINADGTLTYTPAENFNGTDTITYTISDGNGGEDSASVDVTVTPVNDDPVAGDDVAETDEGAAVDIIVLGNDTDIDGDILSVSGASADNGTVVVNIDNTVTYTPDPGFFGEDTITYTISDGNGGTDTADVTVTVNQSLPDAQDDVATAAEDQQIEIAVLGNDTDPGGGELTVTQASAVNGTVLITFEGTLTYTPNADFNGEDTITYTIQNENGGEDTATVTVTVNAVNDAPEGTAPDDPAETANEADGAAQVDLIGRASDVDGDGVIIIAARFIDPTTGAVLAQDITLTGGVANFDPADFGLGDGESLTVQIEYFIRDDSGAVNDTGRGVVDVTIVGADPLPPSNTAPTANAVTLIADEEDGDISVSLSGLVSDPDEGDTLTIISLTADFSGGTGVPVPFTGGVVVGEGGELVFDPTQFGLGNGDQETITLTYTVEDSGGLTSTNTITLELTGDTPGVSGNVAPVAPTIITPIGETPSVDPFSGDVVPWEVTVGAPGAAALVLDLDDYISDPDGPDSALVVTVGDVVIGTDESTGLPIVVTAVFDPVTNQISIPVDDSFPLADGESVIGTLEYTVSDGIDTTTGQITFNYTNPEPVVPVPTDAVLDFEVYDLANGISVDISSDTYEGLTFSGNAIVLNPDEAGGGRNPGGILTGQTTAGGENVLIGNITTSQVPVIDPGTGLQEVDPVTRLPVFETVVDEPFGIFGPGSAFDFEATSVDLGFVSGTPFLPNGFTEGDAFNLDSMSLNIPTGSTTITITTYTIDVTLTPISPGSPFNNGVMDVEVVDTFEFVVDGSNGAAQIDFDSGTYTYTFVDNNNDTISTTFTFDPAMFDNIDGLSIETADGSPIVLDDILITY